MPAVRMSPSLRLFWRIHRAFMRLTGGRFGKVGVNAIDGSVGNYVPGARGDGPVWFDALADRAP